MAMRELKFRAWSKTQKKMLERVLAGLGDPCSIVWDDDRKDWVNFDDACGAIMQFTGLLDKHGKEIYEGDIVRHDDWDLLWIVKWCDGKGENLGNQVGWWLDNGYYKQELIAYLQGDEIGKREEYANATVLGNIHEHPELLKGMGSFGYDPLTGEQR